jgi:ATP-dependent Clp protease ATP-binding subunit ClpA
MTEAPAVTSVYERFTELARRAVVASRDAAESLGHGHVGTEHLLLGLAQTAGTASEVLRAHSVELGRARAEVERLYAAYVREHGAPATRVQSAQDALASIGVDVAEIRRRADEAFGPGALKYPRAAFSIRAKKTVQAALLRARARGVERIDTEHLLLGLLDTGGTGVRVLTGLAVDPEELRRSVLERMDARAPETPA